MRIFIFFIAFLIPTTSLLGVEPKVREIATGTVWRFLGNKISHGDMLPPWKKGEVLSVRFRNSPTVGDKALIIPLGSVKLKPIELEITKAEEVEDECSDELPNYFHVDLSHISDTDYLKVEVKERRSETPFDVIVLYPVPEYAKLIDTQSIDLNILPQDKTIDTIRAAIDLTKDGKPEILVIEYCCEEFEYQKDGCDYTCGETFVYEKGVWKLVDSTQPC